MRRFTGCVALCLGVSAYAAVPAAIDRGALDAREVATPLSITVALALPNLADAEKLNQAIYTRGDPQFHQFLTAGEFAARFAPASADVARVIAAFGKYNLKAEKTTATTLKVSGLPSDFERAFSVSLHSFEVPARGRAAAYRYHAPAGRVVVPAEIAGAVSAVVGLDSSPAVQPQYKVSPPGLKPAPAQATAVSSGYDPLGEWTVTDFAKYYDVQPLYQKGLTGAGRTIGIMTFAAITPSDVFAYWSALGLNVNPNRISTVNVDGGPGAPSDASGSIETSIDVEQSGGVAPGANIIIYQGPDFYATVVDVFAAAVQANKADSLSMSWGYWEWLFNLQNDPVPDPTTGKTVAATQAIHEILLRASLQGQSVFAAAGDGGAYSALTTFGCEPPFSPLVANSCSQTLSVLYPASDSYITAAGGTTLPGTLEFCENQACTPPYYDVTISRESVWGWDYLTGFCKQVLGLTPVACGIFPAGGGGGVSVAFPVPLYQLGVSGTQLSQPLQYFFLQGNGLVDALPAFYPGRNMPDISFNADPETGYLVYYTSDQTGFGITAGYGGTSFVAPQLNGVMALLGQQQRGRVGFLNPTLYSLFQNGFGYLGSSAPFNAITAGDNWFYHGIAGYDLGSGIGTMNVSNFAQALRGEF